MVTVDRSLAPSRRPCKQDCRGGGRDTITPAENATLLLAKLNTEVETLIWEDSIHCCHDRAHIVRPAMADFMARHL